MLEFYTHIIILLDIIRKREKKNLEKPQLDVFMFKPMNTIINEAQFENIFQKGNIFYHLKVAW